MGWRSRVDVLGDCEREVLLGGTFRGFALVAGRAVASWKFDGPRVALTPFAPLDDDVAGALERDGEAVCRFLGR
jgi:hypothetical protein